MLLVPTRFLSRKNGGRNFADENIVVYCKFSRVKEGNEIEKFEVFFSFYDEDVNHLAFENFPNERNSKLVLLQLSICPNKHTFPSKNVYN